jgi:protein TonB
MARASAFGTSLGVHAAVLAAVVTVPLLRDEPPPELRAARIVDYWPDIAPVAMAQERPRDPRPPRRATPRGPERSPSLETPAPAPVTMATDPGDILDDPGPTETDWSGLLVGDASPDGHVGGGGDAVEGGTAPHGGREPQRVGGAIVPPTKVVHVAPVYPEIARIARVSGIVVLDCTIDPAGNVVDVRVLSGNPLLAPAAVEAVNRWRYEPSRLNGVPVSVLMTVTVRFDLKR